jgi:hypothetical protein
VSSLSRALSASRLRVFALLIIFWRSPSPLPSPGEIWLPECGLAKDGVWHCAITANMLVAWSGFEDHGVRWYDVCTGTNPSACNPEALILRSRIAAGLEVSLLL